uniref:Elongation factor 3 n=1 Tax=Albugo laibachii Nc14 TaxID=890382 RepID=F0WH94_9STRA|nr:translation elongation factor 3 (EF3) putative [Albugo laibachii Nc14]|eukprot:CCA20609.1 translation elongation factor 3 (EF3) putative [Albugo laibachii Nc14]
MAPYSPNDGISKLAIDESKHFTEALHQAFKLESDEERKIAAEKISELVNGDTSISLGVVHNELRQGLVGADPNARVIVCIVMEDLLQKYAERMEAYLAPLLVDLLDLFADKKVFVRKAAEEAALTLISSCNKNYTIRLLPALFTGLERSKKWQTKKVSLDLIAELASISPFQIGRCLPDIIPIVTEAMWDTRKDVKDTAKETMVKVCNVVGNGDIEPFIPALISCLANPEEVAECTHKLASTTFVKTVEAPALSIMEPLLQRALKEGKTAVKRQAAVIIDNMCKLMDDPAEAQLFMPKLLPGLNKIIESVADPECREVASRAHSTLFIAGGSVEVSEEDMKVDYDNILRIVTESLSKNAAASKANMDSFCINYVAGICFFLVVSRNFNKVVYEQIVSKYLSKFFNKDNLKSIAADIRERCFKENKSIFIEDVDCDEGVPDLCNCEFSLAYGGMILLNNARLRLKRGHRYGLCGPNGCGKSTLMRAIANGQLEGFPSKDELKTVFVEHNLQASEAMLPVIEFMFCDEELKEVPREEVRESLTSVGFTDEMQHLPVSSLSGGWKMKLELARAMLMQADVLLLDEPTNHLDVKNVAWLENYLNNLPNVTSMIVSHDPGFLDHVCTNIVHYESRKLKTYKGNLSEFVKVKPEARSYYELEAALFHFKFPEPGFLADIKNKGKPIIRLTNCSYTYPGRDKPSISNISVTCALSSRIAVLGPNGAGKSTLIKMLTGEVEPTSGTVWKHPSLRFAYVAQNAFHHIEAHLDLTANQYIQWRFQSGEDKELLAKETRKLSPAEKELIKKPVNWEGEKHTLEEIVSRRKFKKSFEYEIKWLKETETSWVPREKLEKWGWDKLIQIADDREAARANMKARPVTAIAVQKHLDDFGLTAEFGTHSRIRGLSGGQKVKLVLGAAMWLFPHVLVLDEPTNYLDRDSLGALAAAIVNFGGGVVMISHNNEFTSALTQEVWNVEDGKLSIDGQQAEDKTKIEQKDEEEVIDAFGNVTKNKIKRKLTRKEKKAKDKAKKDAEARGEFFSDSDEE